MTARSRSTRVAVAFALSVPALLLFGAVNRASNPQYDLAIPLDSAIPFLPWTFPLYMSFYAYLLMAAALVDAERFKRGVVALTLAVMISFVCFVLLPAAYPQPDADTVAPPWDAAFRWLHHIDGPANTFPSLHVAVTTTVAIMLRDHAFRVLWFTWGTLIVLSTLTVKQHFIADVVGGLVLAGLVSAAVGAGLVPGIRSARANARRTSGTE